MSSNQAVTIYSAPWCAFCHMAKRYLDDHKIEYRDIDVDADPSAARALVEKSGQAGIPVLEIGDRIIVGFDKPKIDDAIKDLKLK